MKIVTVSSSCLLTLISLLMPLALSATWSSRHWSPCCRLWRLCRDTQLILPLLPVLLFPVFLRSIRFESVLSRFSPFVAKISNICSDQGFLLLTVFAKGSTGCSSHCCVEGGDHQIHVSIFVIHDGERWKLPACYSLKVSTILGSFSFSMSILSLVSFGLLILFRWRWRVIISKLW